MTDDGYLHVDRSVRIPLDEFEWRFSGSGGPGGQHANTANTRVELLFDLEHSPSLGPRQRERLMHAFGPTMRVVAADTRSQSRNREIALARLAQRLAGGLRVRRTRVSTKPSRSAKQRRLDSKKTHSQTKQMRQRPTGDD